ncbi:MAG: bifunctional folylpolyglutamate synthase/dihydrofolate synthase [Bacteroidia bacterium]
MTYQQTVEYLFSRLPSYQTQGKSAYKADLSNTIALCKILDNPEKKINTIHLAGTNGKGSTCHMVASIFQEAGYKTGIYSSPHLKDFRERVKINGELISENDVVEFVEKYKTDFEKLQLSFFEWTTGLAFYHFAKQNVDMAIIETGLGGRLDSTNVITPELSIITTIGLDHTDILGETLEKIAIEKAGIIKQTIPVVIGDTQKNIQHVFIEKSKELQAPIYFSEPHHYATDLLGEYQKQNINTAVSACRLLPKNWKITDEHIKNGLTNVVKNTNLQGRWQVLGNQPKMIADVAHNEQGIYAVMNQLQKEKFKQLHIVLGMANDKDHAKILSLLPKKAHYYFCKPDNKRCLEAKELLLKATNIGLKGTAFSSVAEAIQEAIYQSDKDDVIFIGGSTFVVAEAIP